MLFIYTTGWRRRPGPGPKPEDIRKLSKLPIDKIELGNPDESIICLRTPQTPSFLYQQAILEGFSDRPEPFQITKLYVRVIYLE